MTYRFRIVLCLLIITSVSCSNKESLYDNITNKIPQGLNVDKTLPICFFVYNPTSCLNCNSLVSSFTTDPVFVNTFKENVFFVFQGVRETEFLDYKQMLLEQCGVDKNCINDELLYEILLNNSQRDSLNNFDGSVMLAIDKRQDKLIRISMKERYFIDSVSRHFNK